jgi:hypothetical protein
MLPSREPARRNAPLDDPRYVTTVNENDVQLGRGRPVITSEGNRRFRRLIQENKTEYTTSARHAHKDEIARRILFTIGERGGRFLRKLNATAERRLHGIADGVQAWEMVDEETSLQKVKQALREQETWSKAEGVKSKPGRKRKTLQAVADDAPWRGPATRSSASNELESTSVTEQPNQPQGAFEAAASVATRKVREHNIKSSAVAAPPEASAYRTEIPEGRDLLYSLKHPSLRKRDLLRLRRQHAVSEDDSRKLESSNFVTTGGPHQPFLLGSMPPANNRYLDGAATQSEANSSTVLSNKSMSGGALVPSVGSKVESSSHAEEESKP